MQIGRFSRVGEAFAGRLQTLLLDVPLRIVPIERVSEKAPDWRVLFDESDNRVQIGAGWTHRREGNDPFIAVQIDCPTFARPLRAHLRPADERGINHLLLWSRLKVR